MKRVRLSRFFENIKPSGLRVAQEIFERRVEEEIAKGVSPTKAINVAIGNVSLKTHPKLLERYLHPSNPELRGGVWQYTQTQGTKAAQEAFKNIIYSFLPKEVRPELHILVESGGSSVMKTVVLGICGDAGSGERPLLVMDPTYANYKAVSDETGRRIVAIQRRLNKDGKFNDIHRHELLDAIEKYRPGGMLIIPYDNPSGTLMRQRVINEYARICLEHGMFLVSDEAYRGLYYTEDEAPSIWKITNKDVPGIESAGIRISIETLSKVFNACGLRMGAFVTDNEELAEKATMANNTYLCASAIDQDILSALAEEPMGEIQRWVGYLREYYRRVLSYVYEGLRKNLPGVSMSAPEASIYFVVDVKDIAHDGFDAEDFVMFCAKEGAVSLGGDRYTLLTSPMWGFYNVLNNNPGRTQLRIACVEPEDRMKLVPELFARLFVEYEKRAAKSRVPQIA